MLGAHQETCSKPGGSFFWVFLHSWSFDVAQRPQPLCCLFRFMGVVLFQDSLEIVQAVKMSLNLDYVYVYIYIYGYVWIYIYIYVCVYIHIYVYICTHIHLYIYINIFIYIYASVKNDLALFSCCALSALFEVKLVRPEEAGCGVHCGLCHCYGCRLAFCDW